MSVIVEKAATLLDGVRQAANIASWSRSSVNFAYGAPIVTADELDAKALKPFPDRDDVRQILEWCDSGEDLILWKSRQHYASHAIHTSSLWLAAFRDHRSIAYVAQEEQEGKDHIEERIVGMWERLPKYFTDQYKWELKRGIFILAERNGKPWRSFIEPIARGSRKLRSWTYSRIHWDEAAHNDLLEMGYVGAYATVRGSRDKVTGEIRKGQIILSSSAAYHKFFIGLTGSAFEEAREMAIEGAT